MGNPNRGEASFTYKDEVWTLRFNTNALAEFEDAAGCSLAALGGGMGIKQLRALVWAGLGFHHRRKRGTLESVGLMIDEIGAKDMGEVVMRGIKSAFPEAEGDDESPLQAAQDEDGSAS